MHNLARTQKLEQLDNVLDDIRSRYGHFSVQRGIMLTDIDLSNLDARCDHVIHSVVFLNQKFEKQIHLHILSAEGFVMTDKVFVETIVKFDIEGKMTPLSIAWKNGRVYEIDRVSDVRRVASLKAGGMGCRYTCTIRGKERYLFYDLCNKKWFVEGK